MDPYLPAMITTGVVVRFRILAALFLAASTILATAPAEADPLDSVAATTQTALDQERAAEQYATHVGNAAASTLDGGRPNVTCTKPIVYGTELTPHEDLIFAELHQSDYAFASAQCASLGGEPFQMGIEIRIEFCAYRLSLTACRWSTTYYSGWTTNDSIGGVANGFVSAFPVYGDEHAAVGKIRRVFGCVRTTLSTGCLTYDYSATYGH